MKKLIGIFLVTFFSLLYAEPAIMVIDLSKNTDFDDVSDICMVKSLINNDIVIAYEKEWSDLYLSPATYLIIDEELNRKTFFDISLMDSWGQFEVKDNYLLFLKDDMILNIEAYTGRLDRINQSEHLFRPSQDDIDKKQSDERVILTNDEKYLCIKEFSEDYSFQYYYKEPKLPDTISPAAATTGLEPDEALILVHDDSDNMSVWSYNYKNDSFWRSLFLPEEEVRESVYTSQLPYSSKNQYQISVSPDNNWIVAYSYNEEDGLCIFEVYSVQKARTYTTSITMTEGVWVSEPDWSFDSSYFLMFERGESKLIYKVTL